MSSDKSAAGDERALHAEVLAHLRFARAYCAERLPWFSTALFRCRIRLTERTDVASIDLNWNIYWNPTVVRGLWAENDRTTALAELGFLWIHEISHRLREHGERAREFPTEARRWNVACDLEINDSSWEGLQMPTAYPGLLPATFALPEGRLAEWYYAELTKKANEESLNLPQLDEGSGVHGDERPWETGENAQSISALEQELVRRDVARRLAEQGRGTVPRGWVQWSETVLRPKVDWRKLLYNRVSVALRRGIGSRIDYSFKKPGRRQAVYHPVLAPSLGGDKTARIAAVVDTSGSMGAAELTRAVSEIAAVLQVFQHPVSVIPCDLEAYEPIRVGLPSELFQLADLPGGGGTDMTVGITRALHLRPRPDVIVVLTDGFTPYPKQTFAVPVMFAIIRRADGPAPALPTPPFPPDAVLQIDADDPAP